VRQLQNVTRQLVISNRDSTEFCTDSVLSDLFKSDDASREHETPEPRRNPQKRAVKELADGEMLAALRHHRFNLSLTCSELGVSRNWLNKFIERCPHLRKAKDISIDEISRCAAECDNDLNAMADRLQVSTRGLQLQMKRLGL